MNIGEICVRNVIDCRATTSVADAARLMREQHVGDLVVVEARGGKHFPIGMITDRDITVRAVAQSAISVLTLPTTRPTWSEKSA